MKLATYDDDTYELDDGEQMHEDAPETFYIPSLDQRHSLRVGDCVKLVFRMAQPNTDILSVERMWVEITEVKESYYKGFIDNDPQGDVKVKCGDIAIFQPKHVIAIYE
jgi:uncharacterized protein YegJ (DUF2314 family)